MSNSVWLLFRRLKPRLELHEVRLRGLGGPAVCGVPHTCASATGRAPESVIPRERSLGTWTLSRALRATEESTVRTWWLAARQNPCRREAAQANFVKFQRRIMLLEDLTG